MSTFDVSIPTQVDYQTQFKAFLTKPVEISTFADKLGKKVPLQELQEAYEAGKWTPSDWTRLKLNALLTLIKIAGVVALYFTITSSAWIGLAAFSLFLAGMVTYAIIGMLPVDLDRPIVRQRVIDCVATQALSEFMSGFYPDNYTRCREDGFVDYNLVDVKKWLKTEEDPKAEKVQEVYSKNILPFVKAYIDLRGAKNEAKKSVAEKYDEADKKIQWLLMKKIICCQARGFLVEKKQELLEKWVKWKKDQLEAIDVAFKAAEKHYDELYEKAKKEAQAWELLGGINSL